MEQFCTEGRRLEVSCSIAADGWKKAFHRAKLSMRGGEGSRAGGGERDSEIEADSLREPNFRALDGPPYPPHKPERTEKDQVMDLEGSRSARAHGGKKICCEEEGRRLWRSVKIPLLGDAQALWHPTPLLQQSDQLQQRAAFRCS